MLGYPSSRSYTTYLTHFMDCRPFLTHSAQMEGWTWWSIPESLEQVWPGLTKYVKSLAVVRHLPLPAAGSADQRGRERENRGAGKLVGVAKVAIFLCSLDVDYNQVGQLNNNYCWGSTIPCYISLDVDYNQVGQLNIAQGLCRLPSTWSYLAPGNYILWS